MQVKKQQLELDMEQQTGSKLGKEYIKAVYCHPAYLTYIQSTSCEIPSWMKYKIAGRNITDLRYADDTTLMRESEEELRSPLIKVKKESEKAGLKLNMQKTKQNKTKKTQHAKRQAWEAKFSFNFVSFSYVPGLINSSHENFE